MSRYWRWGVVLILAGGVALAAGCNSDDDDGGTGPLVSMLCHGVLPTEIMATDEEGNVVGTGGEDQWCPATGGTEPLQPGWKPAVPNPFNPSTKLRFVLPAESRAQVDIYDAGCDLVRALLDETLAAGGHSLAWDATDDDGHKVDDGYYVCVLTVGDFECAGVVRLIPVVE